MCACVSMKVEPSTAEHGFPRIYRVDEHTRHAINFLLAAIAGLFLFLTTLLLMRVLPHRGSLSGLFWGDITIAGGVLLLGSAYNKQVILYQDAIEVAGWFYSRKLNFAEIRGRRGSGGYRAALGYASMFVPLDSRKHPLSLPSSLRTDQFFRDWIFRTATISSSVNPPK